MTNKELVRQVKQLLAKNKTEDALKLLSKAQLSENDKTVIILMGQLAKLQQDSLINKITNEEKNRMQTSINEAILDLSEKINPREELRYENEIKEAKGVKGINQSSRKNKTTVVSSPDLRNSFFKKKGYWLLLLLIPLGFLIYLSKSTPPTNDGNGVVRGFYQDQTGTEPDPRILEQPESIWSNTNVIYKESFEDRHQSDFRNDIWSYVPNNDDYWMGVQDDGCYGIIIKNDVIKSRHKYLGKINYNTFEELVAYKAKIRLDNNSSCYFNDGCLGRGITIDYHNKEKSAYSFTISDDGVVNFAELKDFNDPENREVLFSETVEIKGEKSIELGVANYLDQYFLFVAGNLVKVLEIDQALNGRFCGVIAIGKGSHLFDEVQLMK